MFFFHERFEGVDGFVRKLLFLVEEERPAIVHLVILKSASNVCKAKAPVEISIVFCSGLESSVALRVADVCCKNQIAKHVVEDGSVSAERQLEKQNKDVDAEGD